MPVNPVKSGPVRWNWLLDIGIQSGPHPKVYGDDIDIIESLENLSAHSFLHVSDKCASANAQCYLRGT